MGRVREEEKKREDQRRERVRIKKMQVHEKVGKPRSTCVSPMICGSGGSKSRLGAIWPDEKHISKSKLLKTDGLRPLLEV